MSFQGTWVTPSKSVTYRVIPKCACSTIGQILYYSDHGEFFNGDIHDAKTGMLKWNQDESHGAISEAVLNPDILNFTCVRNPYTRVLSSFFDKICSIQRNGNRYRGKLVPKLTEKYGVDVDGDFDQIKSFRKFLLFARDTIRFHSPMKPDIHWTAMENHAATIIHNGGKYDAIITVENFKEGMKDVMSRIDTPHSLDIDTMPRFNESALRGAKRAHPVEDFFDDLSMHMVREIYARDFIAFNYDWHDPSRAAPVDEIDLELVHAMFAR